MPNARFAYDPDVAARFPSVAGGVVHAEGVSNGPSPPALIEAFRAEQEGRAGPDRGHATLGVADARRLAPCVPGLRRRPDDLSLGRRGTPAPPHQAGLDPVDQRARRHRQPRRDPLRPAGRDVRPAHGHRAGRPSVSLAGPSRSRISARVSARPPPRARSSSSTTPAWSARGAGAGGNRPRARRVPTRPRCS